MFEQVKQEIDDKIKTNGNNEITANRLNSVLQDMMDASAEVIDEVQQSIGDQVEANPTGEPTESLEKIKIGEEIYEIPQGVPSDMSFDKKLQTQANINNQESSEAGRLGYVVLQPEKQGVATTTFAAQIANKPNTIFEIRDVFDLGGATVTIPSNCVLKFNGGKLVNGILSGDYDVDASDYSCVDVVTSGYNIIGRDTVHSSEIGMVPNTNTSSANNINDAILQKVVNNCKTIILDDLYYLSGRIDINAKVVIQGGSLVFTGAYADVRFKIYNGAGLEVYDCSISCVASTAQIIGITDVNYVIDTIKFENCNIEKVRLVDITCIDADFTINNFGIRNFIIKDCSFNCKTHTILMTNVVILEQCLLSGNYAKNCVGEFFGFGTNNNTTYGDSNRPYNCDIIIENNTFIGAVHDGNSYHCPYLVEANNVFVRNNVISNFIMTGTGVAYEGYVNSTLYRFENNIINNVCSLPSSGTPNSTFSEIFKCKGTVDRIAKGNRWYIDFNECRTILSNAGITFTDEQFDAIKFVIIFDIAYNTDSIVFEGNDVTIIGGFLKLYSPATSHVKKVFINDNKFILDDVDNSGAHALFNTAGGYNEEAYFERNTVSIANQATKLFNVFCPFAKAVTSQRESKLYIRNNISNVRLSIPFLTQNTYYENNIITRQIDESNNILGCNPSSKHRIVIDGYGGGSAVFIFHESNIDNIIINCIETTSNRLLSIASYVQGIIFRIPKYNITKYLHFDLSDESTYTITDEYGEQLFSGSKSSNYIKLIDIDDYNNITIRTSDGVLNIKTRDCEATVEFVDNINSVGAYNEGSTRYDKSSGKMALWNGSSYVNLDSSPLWLNEAYLLNFVEGLVKSIDFGSNLVYIDSSGIFRYVKNYTASESTAQTFVENYPDANIIVSIGTWTDKSSIGGTYLTGASYFNSGSSQNDGIKEIILTIPNNISCIRRIAYNVVNLESAYLSGGDSVINLNEAFYKCGSLKTATININGYPQDMSYSFYNCFSLENVDLSQIDASKLYTIIGLFNNVATIVNLKSFKSNTLKITHTSLYFYLSKLTIESVESIIDSLYDFATNNVNAYDSASTYSIGDLVTNNSNTYICNTDILSAEAFDANKWTQTDKSIKFNTAVVTKYNVGKTTGVDDLATVLAAKGWTLA